MLARFNPLLAPACAVVWLAAAALGIDGQTTASGEAFQNQFPDPLRYAAPVPEPPELSFALVTEIELPGPLVSGPRLKGGQVEILSAAGPLRLDWAGPPAPAVVAPATPAVAVEEPSAWALSPDGKHRAGPVRDRLLVQKVCRGCSSGWRRRWRLRVPGLAPTSPVMTARRVYYGSADNQVYGVRRKNGHRIWATPLEGRVLRTLALWVDPDSPPQPGVAAILAIPEPGREMVVLDAFSGTLVLRYRLAGEDDKLVGAPLTTPDGHVILARQGYTEEDAGLIVLKLAHSGPKADSGADSAATSYNPPTSKEVAPGEPASDQRADSQAPGAAKMR